MPLTRVSLPAGAAAANLGFTPYNSSNPTGFLQPNSPVISTSATINGTANNVVISGGTSGNSITVTATGTDANVDINFVPKGTGVLKVGGILVDDINATATLTNKVISGTANTLTVDGSNTIGFRLIPQNIQSVAYTTVLTDSGKHILHPSADTTARTFTIPANATIAYPIGTAITFINQASAGVITISITTDTMRLAGVGTTGSRTLAANGIATATKLTTIEWIISGVGLT